MKIGCDIVQVNRIRPSLAKRILTNYELDEYQKLDGHAARMYLAGHFAAKEAVFKTLNQDKSDLSKLEIRHCENGSPQCIVDGEIIHLSIAHENDYAMAVALREE